MSFSKVRQWLLAALSDGKATSMVRNGHAFRVVFSILFLSAGLFFASPCSGVPFTFANTGSLATARSGHTATLLPNGKVLVAGGPGATAELYDPMLGTWTATGSLATARSGHTATLLPNGKVLIAGGAGTSTMAELYDPATGTFTTTGSLTIARTNHTATLLPNGKVLVAGGSYLSSCELYDPATGIWTATGNLTTGRQYHTATLLPNGQVLIAGGDSGSAWLVSSELYDSTAGTWTTTGSLTTSRYGHTATLLPNGTVLVAGSGGGGANTAELYNPATGTWTNTGNLTRSRSGHTATLLPNGTVLVAGAWSSGNSGVASAELYDPATGQWMATSNLVTGRYHHTATLLPNGNVLIAGGSANYVNLASAELYTFGKWTTTGGLASARSGHTAILLPGNKVLAAGGTGNGGYLASVELYDPTTGIWTATGNLTTARSNHTATLLHNGKVLIVGGTGNSGYLATAELFDPATGIWTAAGSLATARANHTATLLHNGKVLISAGLGSNGYLATTELYDPATGTWTTTGTLAAARSNHTATLMPDGTVLISAGVGGSGYLASAELYDPAAGTWTTTGTLSTARSDHTATLLPNGKVLIAGGNGSSGYLASSELYDPTAGTWTSAGNLTTARRGHTVTLLPNGTILITGGWNGSYLTNAELYNPVTGTWTTNSLGLTEARSRHTATILPGGKVLIVGGNGSSGSLSSAELCDPSAGAWTTTGSSITGHSGHTETLLPNGMVLLAGGTGNSAELYNPATGIWAATGNLTAARSGHTATLLPNGKVLVAGGNNLPSCELYDPVTGTWTTTGSLTTGRQYHTATLLANGKVLVAGGGNTIQSIPYTLGTYFTSVELYDPATGIWTVTGSLANARAFHSATLLPNGKVLVVAGRTTDDRYSHPKTATAELYDPVTGVWTATGSPDGIEAHTATLLPNGKVLVAGGRYVGPYSNGIYYDYTTNGAALYDPVTGVWTATGSLGTTRAYHTATLLPNGKVLVAGGSFCSNQTNFNFSFLNSAEVYDPATGIWTSTGNLNATCSSHTATLLPNGKVLTALGNDAELYDTGLGFNSPAWQPQIATATSTLAPGGNLTLTGSGFIGISGASGGNTQDSSTNYPLVQLRSLDNGQVTFLTPNPTTGWSDSSFTSVPVNGFPFGPALVTVFTNGIPNVSRMVVVLDSSAPPSSLAYATNPASYVVNQSIANNTPTFSGGAPSIYSITPSLPTGLSFNSVTGVISGVPTVIASATNYTVTAANALGSTTAVLNLSVNSDPGVVTGTASGITSSIATLNGTVNSGGLPTTVYFQYGKTIDYAGITGTMDGGSGTSTTPYSAEISELTPGTTYHFQIVAFNSLGTTYGLDQTFTTANPPPTVITGTATGIGYDSATLNGMINANGLSTTFYFRYGTSTGYGDATSTQNAGSGSSSSPFSLAIGGLNPLTLYHFQLVATNSSGKSYGLDQTFTTANPPPAPPTPTGLTATAGNARVTLLWNPSTGAAGYNVKRSLTSGTNYAVIADNIPATACTDISVANGTTYYYVISAMNLGGESGNTSEVAVTPQASKVPILSTSGSNVLVTIPDSLGSSYQLQRNDTLNPPDWVNIGSLQPGNGGTLLLQDIGGATGITRRFYRVLIHQ